jgi:uncharacterized repeat protein (TIGR01451 family)
VSINPVSTRSVSIRSTHLRPIPLAWVGGLIVGLSAMGISPAFGQTTTSTTLYDETFINSALNNTAGYIVGGTPGSVCLTASTQTATYPQIGQCPAGSAALPATGDPSGTGALRLTSNVDPVTLVPTSAGERGFFINNTAIPANEGLLIEFQFFTYNGKSFFAGSDPGGDGLSFFLIDGNANPTEPGAFGGSLGYAQRASVNGQLPVPGLAGAYVGIGFDEFGNFSNSNEGRSGGGTTLQPDSIALRGPANPTDPTRFTGYDFIASATPGPSIDSAASINTQATSRTDAQVAPRKARITLTNTGDLTVEIDFTGTGNSYTSLPALSRNIRALNPNVPFPPTFKFGFAASTGTSTAIHEVRNVKITTVPVVVPPPPPPIPVEQQLRLIKRVTAITRSGVRTAFTQVVDDPNDPNDTLAGWTQLTGGLVGVPIVGAADRLQTGDDIEYTIYYLAEGNTTLLDPKICDAVPARTTLVPNSLQISQNNSALIAGGTAFSRLQPLPAAASACTDQTNSNGSVLFDLGNLPVTNSTNRPATPTVNVVGAVRFKARIN